MTDLINLKEARRILGAKYFLNGSLLEIDEHTLLSVQLDAEHDNDEDAIKVKPIVELVFDIRRSSSLRLGIAVDLSYQHLQHRAEEFVDQLGKAIYDSGPTSLLTRAAKKNNWNTLYGRRLLEIKIEDTQVQAIVDDSFQGDSDTIWVSIPYQYLDNIPEGVKKMTEELKEAAEQAMYAEEEKKAVQKSKEKEDRRNLYERLRQEFENEI